MTNTRLNPWIRTCVMAGLLLSGGASAATLTVNTPIDELNSDGDCSLREALQSAETDTAVDACAAGSGADTIELPQDTYALTLSGAGENAGATGDLDVTTEITIRGTSLLTVIDGQGLDRVAEVLPGGKLTLSSVTLANGKAMRGGAVSNSGELILINALIRDSRAHHGGGIYNAGVLTARNATFMFNVAQGMPGHGGGGNSGTQGAGGGGAGLGGGLFHAGTAALLTGCTFTGNSAAGGRGGNASDSTWDGAGGAIGGGAGGNNAPGSAATDLGGGGGGGGGGWAGHWAGRAGGAGSLGGGQGGFGIDFFGVNGGGGGGAGLGGGVFVATGGLTLDASVLRSNSASGGAGGTPGCASWGQCGGDGLTGAGLGGGVFVYGNPVVFSAAEVFNNTSASDPSCQQVDGQTGEANNPSFPGGRCNVAYGTNPGAMLSRISDESAGANCVHGGKKFDVGYDNDGNGSLSNGEVSTTSYACASSPSSLMNVTPASATECTHGGQKVEVGADDDGSGTLDASEVDSMQFICNGADGADGTNGTDGLSVIASVTTEPAGTNCANGGQKVQVGQDADRDGQLDASEVQGTSWVCNGADGSNGSNGADGKQTLIDIGSEPAGANCAEGGQKLQYGTDDDGNGQLEAAEVDGTRYLCTGLSGQDGHSTLVRVEAIAAGETCANGGQRLITGVDANDNDQLDAEEISSTTEICNGTPGEQGEQGEGGADGRSSLVAVSAASNEACPAGGQTVKTGLDANGNGTLDVEEVGSSIDVCQSSCSVSGGGGQNATITCSDGTSATVGGSGCSAVGGSSSLIWMLGLMGLPLIRRRRSQA